MAQFLDTTGLQTLWNKIKETFVPQNWLMVDFSGTLQQTPAMGSACPINTISGDVGFYKVGSGSNVSGETVFNLLCIDGGNTNVYLCSCVFKAGFTVQNAIRTLINLGIVSMSGNLTNGAQLSPLRKIVKFSDSEYLVPIISSVGGVWIFYDNFNDALSALLSGNDTTQTS